MLPLRFTTLLFLAAAISPAAAQPKTTDSVPPTCPATKPQQTSYLPPPPYPQRIGEGYFWFGSDALWVALPVNSIWSLGHYQPGEPTFRQKLLWYRKGYNANEEPDPPLIVTGRRLDEAAPPLDVDGPHGAWLSGDPRQQFMTTGLNIPATGCWEIIGQYQQDTLTFVVWVADGSALTQYAVPGRGT
jgi:hypothetical protein